MQRRRTKFSANVNYHGWWLRSSKGAIAQMLALKTRDLRDRICYALQHFSPICTLSDTYPRTIDWVLDNNCTIYRTRGEAENAALDTRQPQVSTEIIPEPAETPVRLSRRIFRRK